MTNHSNLFLKVSEVGRGSHFYPEAPYFPCPNDLENNGTSTALACNKY